MGLQNAQGSSEASNRSTKKRGSDISETGKSSKRTKTSQGLIIDISSDAYEIIKDLAKKGGPDLSDIRGFEMSASPSQVSAKEKRPQNDSQGPPPEKGQCEGANSTGSGYQEIGTATSDPYGPKFVSRARESGIMLPYEIDKDGREFPSPVNFTDISLRMEKGRECNDLSQELRQDTFTSFRNLIFRTRSEKGVLVGLAEYIIESPFSKYSSLDILFDNLEMFPAGFKTLQPDYFEGSSLWRLEIEDATLKHKIVPTSSAVDPILPTFFVEMEKPGGELNIAVHKVAHAGANGARSFRALQQHKVQGISETFDNKAYTICATFDGYSLELLTAYVHENPENKEKPWYIIKSLGFWRLTANLESYVNGVTAFRNLSDWAEEKRNQIIEDANRRAKKMGY